MAWAEVFTPILWTNGDYLTEVKLRQDVANDQYLRDQVSVSHPFYWNKHQTYSSGPDGLGNAYPCRIAGESNPNLFIAEVLIDGVAYYTGPAFGTGAAVEDHGNDIDISAVSEGLHTLTLRLRHTSLGHTHAVTTQFVKNQEMEKMTCWITRQGFTSATPDYGAVIDHATVIFHREIKGW